MNPFEVEARLVVARRRARGLERRLRVCAPAVGGWTRVGGRRLLDFAANDYLGLARDPRVRRAAGEALRRWGAGARAAPLVTGYGPAHAELAAELRRLKGAAEALLFPCGYGANVGTLAALCRPGDAVFVDRQSHASLWDGVRLSGAACHVFRHRDVDHLEELLRRHPPARGGRRVIVTNGVFSMDGWVAPLRELAAAAAAYEALLVVDDAHGTGVVGPEGAGCVREFGVRGVPFVETVTLSKALGAQGGVVLTSGAVGELLRHRARSFVYSTGLAPPLAAAATAALRIVRSEEGRRRRARQQEHAARLAAGLRAKGYRVRWEAPAPMVVFPQPRKHPRPR